MKKQPTGIFNSWDQSIEPGVRLYDPINKKVYDIYESSGWFKRTSGVLSTREPKLQKQGKIPIEINEIWYWD